MKGRYFTTLKRDHELFEKLKNENPEWWQFVKDNFVPAGFYVDVRKDNSLNVYFNGGSVLKITLVRGEIKGKIHNYYLGETSSKYVNYDLYSLPKDVKGIKEKILTRYSDSSENGIKAKLINTSNNNYIDTEFAYPKIIGKKINSKGKEVDAYLTTRIDLAKLENGKIVFVELKRIEDSRLLTDKDKNGISKVISQMKAYHQFISSNKDEITEYYKTLFLIKRDLNILPNGLVGLDNIDDYVLSDNVELYVEPYSKLNPQREKRLDAIRAILDANKIIHNL